jgi:uncharacterized protein (TIGR01777 family)
MPAKIVVAGASGFIGRPLCRALFAEGKREVWALSRQRGIEIPYARVVHWDGITQGEWVTALDGAQAVINLSGAGIADRRWSPERKLELLNSRLDPTRALVAAMAATPDGPSVFINASAVGYYGDRGDEGLEEDSDPGQGFLAELCADWEKEALKAPPTVRAVALRVGIVLGQGGGALRRMVPPFSLGLGGPIGTGAQWMSWISRDDLIGLIIHLLEAKVAGPVNATAPQPVTNARFSETLASALNRRARLRMPAGVVSLLFGEMGSMLLGGQRVLPKRALDSGYRFQHPVLAGALASELR